MKKIALLLLMLFPVVGYSQDYKWFICHSESDARILSDSIAFNSKSKFQFDTAKISNFDKTRYVVSYIDKNDTLEPTKLNVVFGMYMKGANKDLEIVGTREYLLSFVHAKYLDIFPFWKKFINPKADLKILSEKTSDKVITILPDGQHIEFRLAKNGEIWTMRMVVY